LILVFFQNVHELIQNVLWGIRSSGASGELLASHVLKQSQALEHADAFLPSRFDDPEYVKSLEGRSCLGQV
jgi:hypothetical protein